jgi:hypothetical protein
MSLSSTQISNQITTKYSALQATETANQFKLTLPGGKEYRVVTNDSGIATSVTRDNPSDSRWDKFKTSIANFFGTSNNARALKVFQRMDANPGNIVATNATNATTRVQAAFRGFIARKDLKKENEFGFKPMVNQKANRTYYFDPKKQMHHLRSPDNPVPNGSHGSYKKVIKEDDHYIALRPIRLKFNSDHEKKHQQTLRELSGYDSIVQACVVESDLILAQNGGKEVRSEFTKKGKNLQLSQYRQACKDMGNAHAKGIVFRDIKNSNFVVNGRNGMVRFIDLDDVATSDSGTYRKRCGTPKMLTRNIFAGKASGDISLIKTGDNYAMLISMIEGTDRTLRYDISDNNGLNNNGILNTRNESKFQFWVETYIQPEHQKDTLKFLSNPSENPLEVPLHTMIKWDG